MKSLQCITMQNLNISQIPSLTKSVHLEMLWYSRAYPGK